MRIEEATGRTPKALESAPTIRLAILQEVLTAYNMLASRRTIGMAANPIQLSEIKAYIDIYGPPSIAVDLFIDLVGLMDIKYLELSHGHSPTSNR